MRKDAQSMYDIASMRYHWDFIVKNYSTVIDYVLFSSHISNESVFSDIKVKPVWPIISKNYSPKLTFFKTLYNIFL